MISVLRATAIAVLLALAGSPAFAQANNIDTRPHNVAAADRDPRLAEDMQGEIDKLKDLSGKLDKLADIVKTLTNGKVNIDTKTPFDLSGLKSLGLKNSQVDPIALLQTALNLMEAFNVIDPRENFLQPDYNPKGLPPLPSRAVKDATLSPEEYGEFLGLQRDINHAKEFLEKNFIVLKQTELKTKRLEDLADSAGSMSGIAGMYWANVKANPNDPMNKSKAAFYAKYDQGQKSGLDFLDAALKKMSDFEYKKYGDRNWYLYFGLPYYNFMVARYTRA
ncbi:MAG: hypothetical protein HY243_02285 [Proteobacteria bacterium]|nr:hypothetical protein [Pseudomonadota bacterium]